MRNRKEEQNLDKERFENGREHLQMEWTARQRRGKAAGKSPKYIR